MIDICSITFFICCSRLYSKNSGIIEEFLEQTIIILATTFKYSKKYLITQIFNILGCKGIPQNNEVRTDGRCGPRFLAPNGLPAKCDARSNQYCCSAWGWCGIDLSLYARAGELYEDHCRCPTCIDFRSEKSEKIRKKLNVSVFLS